MSMQVTPLPPTASRSATAVAPAGAGTALVSTRAAAVPASDQAVVSADPVAPRAPIAAPRGLRGIDSQLQQQLADAQRAQAFLDQTASQLQSLKSELSAKLAGLDARSSQLQDQLSQIVSTWRSRQTATGGSVDGQLNFTSPQPAQQRFSVRGLDMGALKSNGRETLTFSVAGSSNGLIAIAVDPSEPAEALVQRFDQALAPTGIRVSADSSGAMIFSTDEARWAAVRDSLAIKGDGIRFPTGQMHRARTDAEPEAVQPERWSTTDSGALRQALQQVVQAIDRVKQARAAVSQALAQAALRVDQARPPDNAPAAAALAQNFESTGGQAGFQAFSSLASALIGVSRSRVTALLSLPPTA